MKNAEMIAKRWIAVLVLSLLTSAAHADSWKATISEKHYRIDGTTPIALYESIGQRGPIIKGDRRTIAITTWDLKWRRDYQRQNAGCVLASALPFLAINYELPRPAQKLPASLNARWQIFYDGIKTHELQHGEMIRNLVRVIINETVGLTTEQDDGNCNQLRAKVLAKVKTAFDTYTRQTAEFERIEMSKGGNVHSLVLGFLNR